MKVLKAGIAYRDVSPSQGVPLGGYPHCPRHNTGVHDPLIASCIDLCDGNNEIVIAAMDLLWLSKQYVNTVRQRVRKECGIPAGNIMMTCAHTHSGPWAAGGIDEETLSDNEDPEYINALIDKLTAMMVEAKKTAFDAKVAITKDYCCPEQGIGGNRRDPKGPADADVCIISVKDSSDTLKGIYLSYALHPTVIHEDSTVVTADFPGYTRLYLKEKYPNAVLVYAQGASGNQSSRYFRQGQSFDEAKRIGEEIGKAAAAVIDGLEYASDISLGAESAEMPIKTRSVPPLEVLEQNVKDFSRIYEELKAKNAPYIEVQNANLKNLGAEDLLAFAQAQKNGKLRLLNEEDPAEVQVITIGDARLVGLPGEVFVEFGLDIKKRSKYAHTFVNTLTNGCLPGYVCTKESYETGGYEIGASFLDPAFGYELADTAVRLINGGEEKK
jgi:hypothetical protein